jgi:hypothetical protein
VLKSFLYRVDVDRQGSNFTGKSRIVYVVFVRMSKSWGEGGGNRSRSASKNS